MLYRICFKYCVPILRHFWQKMVCWELFKVLGSSHCPVGSMGQWLLPENSNSSQQTGFDQKWLKIGTQYLKHILYNISKSHNFCKKCAHVNIYSKYVLCIPHKQWLVIDVVYCNIWYDSRPIGYSHRQCIIQQCLTGNYVSIYQNVSHCTQWKSELST